MGFNSGFKGLIFKFLDSKLEDKRLCTRASDLSQYCFLISQNYCNLISFPVSTKFGTQFRLLYTYINIHTDAMYARQLSAPLDGTLKNSRIHCSMFP